MGLLSEQPSHFPEKSAGIPRFSEKTLSLSFEKNGALIVVSSKVAQQIDSTYFYNRKACVNCTNALQEDVVCRLLHKFFLDMRLIRLVEKVHSGKRSKHSC